jgi:hypothetical protein
MRSHGYADAERHSHAEAASYAASTPISYSIGMVRFVELASKPREFHPCECSGLIL